MEALGLCSSFSSAATTPAETSPLPKDSLGVPATGKFNYAAVVGMLLFLCGLTCPDIAFAVNHALVICFVPLGTMMRGLYGHKDSQDPHCTCSQTGCLIMVFNCPVLWKSKLQIENHPFHHGG
ncbi:hypothetical protein ACHAW6_004750 [Cyclotella cf. meneghiniana]